MANNLCWMCGSPADSSEHRVKKADLDNTIPHGQNVMTNWWRFTGDWDGSRSRVSEFFSGKRRLSVPQMVKIRQVLKVPADLLLDDSRAERRAQVGATKSRGKRKRIARGD